MKDQDAASDLLRRLEVLVKSPPKNTLKDAPRRRRRRLKPDEFCPPSIRENGQFQLVCPRCACINTHIREVYTRDGDDEGGVYKGTEIKEQGTFRRSALVIVLDCEECGDAEQRLVIQQHKGINYFWSELGASIDDICESPIEKLFFHALPVQWRRDGNMVIGNGQDFGAVPQWIEGDYRIDFMLEMYNKSKKVAVELDGHDFHEKTKEQAQRDKSRDRELTARGWTVLRFTGSEVHSNAYACVSEVLQILGADTFQFPSGENLTWKPSV